LDFPQQILTDLEYDPETGAIWRRHSYFPKFENTRADKIADLRGGYRFVTYKQRVFAAHRLAWLLTHGHLPKLLIDHINGDPADNRLFNLRLATNSENLRNRGANAGRSLPKGVSLVQASGRYMTSIGLDNRIIYLGTFPTVAEAAAAYSEAAARFHGEFARLA